MTKHITKPLHTLGFMALLLAGAQALADKEDIHMFPEADKNQDRFVIRVPEQEDESLFKLEIVASRLQKADCNLRALRGELDQESVKGWGYSYYELEDVKPGPSTMMACPQPAKKRYVPIVGKEFTLRYNSRLPYVIYVPKGIDVKFRIWRTTLNAESASEK
ncbi:Ecotin [BD1-7 clade bacterium]|uniref:Ecotin n=1 Tax=BD1-7 clade bacterium TaxID=2029982 RepID=A0A5S9R0G0_9GAMM|nr:Ecotin [BD1-7 clade bacterium]